MKIAIGLISTTFGMLLVVYGMINKASYLIVEKVGKISSTTGMLPLLESPGIYSELIILVGVILVVLGCVTYERGIKEK